jgi:hypothetical protein
MTDKTQGPTPTNSPSEAQGGQPMAQSGPGGLANLPADHPYNAPDLSPLAFLTAVYRDASVDISHRILAAHHAAPYTAHPQGLKWEDRDPMDRVTIVIGGIESVSIERQGQEPRPDAPGPDDHPDLLH